MQHVVCMCRAFRPGCCEAGRPGYLLRPSSQQPGLKARHMQTTWCMAGVCTQRLMQYPLVSQGGAFFKCCDPVRARTL